MKKLITDYNTILDTGRDYYHEVDRGSNTLVITVGDSWTWGDRLGKTTLEYDDREYRTNHIYGAVIAQQLGADFINIAFPGRCNTKILTAFKNVYSMLVRNYEKCYVFFTLTESGREITNGLYEQHDHYNELRGKDWPTWESIFDQSASIDSIKFAQEEMYTNQIELVHCFNLATELLKAKSVDDFFSRYERLTFENIRQTFESLPDKVDWIVSRNFTSVRSENAVLFQSKNLTTVRWVDVIAQQGKLAPYPNNVDVVSGMGLNPIVKWSQVHGLAQYRKEWIDVFDLSQQAVDWLEKSPYNGKVGSRHPNEQAHAWWAEHLLSKIQ